MINDIIRCECGAPFDPATQTFTEPHAEYCQQANRKHGYSVRIGGGKRNHPEHDLQCAIIEWCELHKDAYPHLDRIYANPLGGKRPMKTALAMKAEGAKAGIPDLTLPVPILPYHGAYFELKIKPNKPTDKQRDWIDYLGSVGYYTAVVYSLDDFIFQIENYYSLGMDDPE